jgi:branched-chain amino acid transport system substrate-binding protein
MPLTRRGILCGSLGTVAAGLPTRQAAAASDPIRFGWLTALTGPNSAPGIGFNRGVIYAADKINAAGGIGGRMIEIVTRDTQGDPAKAVNAAVELASNVKVHATFGPTNSGESLATTPIFARFKVPSLQVVQLDQLIDPAKYPNAFRFAPNNSQWDDANRHYITDVLKAKKVAVIGDNTGYGTTATAVSVASFKAAGIEVVYDAVVEANAQDTSPYLLRARSAGAEVVAVWSDATGLNARMMNARGQIGWDVAFCGHPSMGSGDVARLLEKPAYWEKVYIIGYRSCTFDSNGKLPAPTQAFIDEVKGKIQLNDTTLWWVMAAVDAVHLVSEAVAKSGSSDADAIIGTWNKLTRWPGLFGDISFTPETHNGYPTSEVVMSLANSAHDGAFTLAPGYA